MKNIRIITLCLIIPFIATLGGCSKDSKKQTYWGYWSPGDLRPKGLAREKCYRFDFVSKANPTAEVPDPPEEHIAKVCSSGTDINDPSTIDITNTTTTGRCAAIYGVWLTGTSYQNSLGSEGIAVKDTHETKPTFMLKIVRFVGQQEWDIILSLNGVVYTGKTAAIELTVSESADETTPAYTPQATSDTPNPTPLAGSGVKLKLVSARFLENIILTSSGGTITINRTEGSTNYILAQAY